jgi:hypothetical protein
MNKTDSHNNLSRGNNDSIEKGLKNVDLNLKKSQLKSWQPPAPVQSGDHPTFQLSFISMVKVEVHQKQ